MPLLQVCGCGALVERKPCDQCKAGARVAERERSRRRRTEPHQGVMFDPRWPKVRDHVRARNRTCVRHNDGRCRGKLQVHHVHPVKLGGAPFDPANLRLLCRFHHGLAERDARRVHASAGA